MKLLRSLALALVFTLLMSLANIQLVYASCHKTKTAKHHHYKHHKHHRSYCSSERRTYNCSSCCNYLDCAPQPIYRCTTEFSYHHGRNSSRVEVCEAVSYYCGNWMYDPYSCDRAAF